MQNFRYVATPILAAQTVNAIEKHFLPFGNNIKSERHQSFDKNGTRIEQRGYK